MARKLSKYKRLAVPLVPLLAFFLVSFLMTGDAMAGIASVRAQAKYVVKKLFGAPVDVGTPTDDHVLTYDASTGKWGAEAAASAEVTTWTEDHDTGGFNLTSAEKFIGDGGTLDLDDTGVTINTVAATDMIFKTADTTALTLSAAQLATFAGSVEITGNLTQGAGAAWLGNSASSFDFLPGTGQELRLLDEGNSEALVIETTGDVTLGFDLTLAGDLSKSGASTFDIQSAASQDVTITTNGGSLAATFSSSAHTFNVDGAEIGSFTASSGDFRITPAAGEQLVLAEDGGASAIVIGTSGITVFGIGARVNDNIDLNLGTGLDVKHRWATAPATDVYRVGHDAANGLIEHVAIAEIGSDYGVANPVAGGHPVWRIWSDEAAGAGGDDEFIELFVSAAGEPTIGAGAGAASGGIGLAPNANTGALQIASNEETLATTSGGSVSTTNLIPAGAIPVAVTVRVLTAVTTSSASNTFNVSYNDAAGVEFGDSIAGALDTTTDESDWTVNPTAQWSASTAEIHLDAEAAETFTAGSVKVTVYYLICAPEAS